MLHVLQKKASPTLIDVILTNRPEYYQNITNFCCGLSDVHNLISFQLKGHIPKFKRDLIQYRSFKDFDNEQFIKDLQSLELEKNITAINDVDNAYANFKKEFLIVVDKHIPMKKRKPIVSPAPYMNKNLRKAIY